MPNKNSPRNSKIYYTITGTKTTDSNQWQKNDFIQLEVIFKRFVFLNIADRSEEGNMMTNISVQEGYSLFMGLFLDNRDLWLVRCV